MLAQDLSTFFPWWIEGKEQKNIAQKVVQMVRCLPDRKNKQYVAVMDNYFTFPKTIIGLRKCGVATLGTARNRYVTFILVCQVWMKLFWNIFSHNKCLFISMFYTEEELKVVGHHKKYVNMMRNVTMYFIIWMIKTTFVFFVGSITVL